MEPGSPFDPTELLAAGLALALLAGCVFGSPTRPSSGARPGLQRDAP